MYEYTVQSTVNRVSRQLLLTFPLGRCRGTEACSVQVFWPEFVVLGRSVLALPDVDCVCSACAVR